MNFQDAKLAPCTEEEGEISNTFHLHLLSSELLCWVAFYEDTRAQLDAISMALAELQAKEPTKKERKTIRFVQYDK